MQALDNWVSQATGVTCHSGEVQPGIIFVAICGRSVDGNSFARTAADRGALAVVSDCPQNLPPLSIPVIAVTNARLTLSALAAAFYKNPSHQLKLTGITGSNGKTTIACMLEHIFLESGLQSGLIGTIRVNTGKASFPSRLTTPDAVSLQYYLAQMLNNKVTHAAMEVSAQGIDMHRVAHVRFSAGILSNLCADHLDFHGNYASYLAAKAKFLDLLAPDAPLIINWADANCKAMAAGFSGRVITAAVGKEADLTAHINRQTAYGCTFTLAINTPFATLAGQAQPIGRHAITLALPGRHNVENALLAAAAALLHSLPPAAIARALATFRSVTRRMDVFHLHGLTVIDDTALNPGSIQAVFDTIPLFRYKRLIVVNAIRGHRGAAINAANAATFASIRQKIPFHFIITASSNDVGWADAVTQEERLAFMTTLSRLNTGFTFFSTLAGALKEALNYALPGDLIVLTGAQGMDAGREILTSVTNSQTNHDQFPASSSIAALVP